MYKHYFGGELKQGKGEQYEVINPANEETVGSLKHINTSQADKALKAAKKAFPKWSALSLNERKKWIDKLKEAIIEKKETIVDILMAETGKTNVMGDYGMLIKCLDFFIEEAKRLKGSIIPDYDNNFHNYIIREPLGVVVGYLAWNFPLLNLGYKLGPVLASGCTCIIKPSSKTPLATLYIGQIAKEIGFPEGVINIISGPSKEIGTYLTKSKIPGMITMIGSSEAGKQIIEDSATSIKRFSLELGGNAPVIIMPDADIEKAARKMVNMKFKNNAGQVCVAPNRIFVHETIHDQFVEKAKKLTKEISPEWDKTKAAEIGPIITEYERDRIMNLVENAVDSGAELVCGGTIPENQKGYYLNPTILDKVKPNMEVAKKEIFGPVMPVLQFNDKKAVIKEANNTEYGLAAYLYGEKYKDIFEISEALKFGTVCVNEPFFDVNLPHGGFKESGIGKDCSVYSLEEYYNIKRITIKK